MKGAAGIKRFFLLSFLSSSAAPSEAMESEAHYTSPEAAGLRPVIFFCAEFGLVQSSSSSTYSVVSDQ
jgi:hypothetical protein